MIEGHRRSFPTFYKRTRALHGMVTKLERDEMPVGQKRVPPKTLSLKDKLTKAAFPVSFLTHSQMSSIFFEVAFAEATRTERWATQSVSNNMFPPKKATQMNRTCSDVRKIRISTVGTSCRPSWKLSWSTSCRCSQKPLWLTWSFARLASWQQGFLSANELSWVWCV